MWQLIHGRFEVSVEHVPLLGNHVEPIVFLFAPLFAVFRHPMLFVVVQNAALAAMAPIGFAIARRYFDRTTAALLSVALLIMPATGYVALHEFHPEALTAPLILLMIYSRAVRRLGLHWICFIGVLACKENMALLLGAYCIVFLVIERRSARHDSGTNCGRIPHRQDADATFPLFRWYGAPMIVAVVWFVVCTKLITPAFNSGNIDYLGLYDRLGNNAPEIVLNIVTNPRLLAETLWNALTHGNLFWALLLPFLGLPLLRPRWLIVAAPVLLQHLLSWRSSEWTIYFHYAAPLIPLFWIGAIEALVRLAQRFGYLPAAMEGRAPASRGSLRLKRGGVAGAPPSIALVAALMVVGCLTGQIWVGPAPVLISELSHPSKYLADRMRKQRLIAEIPPDASVVAPLPYLSHLAMREKLYSLHYILKGLKTLSRERYEPPPPTDFVLIDYADSATFDAGAGYYHPQMRTRNGDIIPSSDQLLQNFLDQAAWEKQSDGRIVLLRRKAR